jgi:hypothetical protein
MGLHGGHVNQNKRNNGHHHHSSMFPNQATSSMDGDSDADSWAQTDGTIGSLELQLEPITAEV